jgi:predicted N-acetyltransferase YhbS
MRNANEFIKKLDYVVIVNDEIVGNIVYVKAKIIGAGKEYDVLTFGPVSVLPKCQKKRHREKINRTYN